MRADLRVALVSLINFGQCLDFDSIVPMAVVTANVLADMQNLGLLRRTSQSVWSVQALRGSFAQSLH